MSLTETDKQYSIDVIDIYNVFTENIEYKMFKTKFNHLASKTR